MTHNIPGCLELRHPSPEGKVPLYNGPRLCKLVMLGKYHFIIYIEVTCKRIRSCVTSNNRNTLIRFMIFNNIN